MILATARCKRTDTLFTYTKSFRSVEAFAFGIFIGAEPVLCRLAIGERPDEQAAGLAPFGGRPRLALEQRGVALRETIIVEGERLEVRAGRDLDPYARGVGLFLRGFFLRLGIQLGRASCRERGCQLV